MSIRRKSRPSTKKSRQKKVAPVKKRRASKKKAYQKNKKTAAPSKKARQRKKKLSLRKVFAKRKKRCIPNMMLYARMALTGSANFKLGFYNAPVKIDGIA